MGFRERFEQTVGIDASAIEAIRHMALTCAVLDPTEDRNRPLRLHAAMAWQIRGNV